LAFVIGAARGYAEDVNAPVAGLLVSLLAMSTWAQSPTPRRPRF